MKPYLRAQSLWDVVEKGNNPPPLPNNPTLAQIRNHSDKVAKEGRALACRRISVGTRGYLR